MAGLRILVVEDQHDLAANIWDFLERRGHIVDHAADGAAGLAQALENHFDGVVLDLGLPRLDGLDLCRRLRAAGRGVPVLMLTARDTLEDKLRGFAEGADDYMVKPFELRELEMRLRALHRRQNPPAGRLMVAGPLSLEPEAMIARREGAQICLSQTQCALLEELMRRSPAVVSHEALASRVWDDDSRNVANLHNHVYALRQIVDKPFPVALIRSVRGVGYRLVVPDG